MELMDVIRRCQSGDEEAFAALFHQYKDLVFKTAYLILNSTDEAEDVLQEVFLQVHRSLSKYEPSRGSFTTWLYRITVNRCLSWRRKRHLSLVSLEEAPAPSVVEYPSLQRRLEDEESIQQALSRLSEKQRAVIVLRYYQGLPYSEIAEVLDIPLGTVKSRLDLALKTLQRELGMLTGDTPSLCALPRKEVAR